MAISPWALSLLLAGFAWQQAACAAPLYKWTDGAGHVTYSSLPPPAGARARTIDIAPAPSADATRQAEARAQRMREQTRELEARRREQEAREAEEARLRAMRAPPVPIVIEKPVYVPQPVYYPPVKPSRKAHPDRPSRHRPR